MSSTGTVYIVKNCDIYANHVVSASPSLAQLRPSTLPPSSADRCVLLHISLFEHESRRSTHRHQ